MSAERPAESANTGSVAPADVVQDEPEDHAHDGEQDGAVANDA